MPSKRLVPLIAIACLIPAVLDSAGVAVQGWLRGEATPWNSIVWQGSEWLIFGLLTPLAWSASRRYPLRWPMPLGHLAWHVVSALALCVLWATLGTLLRWALDITDPANDGHVQLLSWVITSVPWSVFMYFSVAGSMHALDLWSEAQQARATTSTLEARLADARLDALRRQIHPHFLFNSLNAVTVLVRDGDTSGASSMLERLTRMLRSILGANHGQLVALRDDVHFAEDYVAIERARFPDRLHVHWDVAPELGSHLVPALLLQPLIENAIRHGIAPHDRAGRIDVRAARDGSTLSITVIDDGPAWSPAPDASGVGLQNTRERLLALYKGRATLTLERQSERTVATIRIPLDA